MKTCARSGRRSAQHLHDSKVNTGIEKGITLLYLFPPIKADETSRRKRGYANHTAQPRYHTAILPTIKQHSRTTQSYK